MHLMSFMTLTKPGLFFRALILGAQGGEFLHDETPIASERLILPLCLDSLLQPLLLHVPALAQGGAQVCRESHSF